MKNTTRLLSILACIGALSFPVQAQFPTDTVTIHVQNQFWKTNAPATGVTLDFYGAGSFAPIQVIPSPDMSSLDIRYVPAEIQSPFCYLGDKQGDATNGVNVGDMVSIMQHILGSKPLPLGFSRLAADVNRSNSITTFDIVEATKLILGIYQELPNKEPWIVLPNDFFASQVACLPAPLNPTQFIDTTLLITVKTGDVDGDANPSGPYKLPTNSWLTLGMPNTVVQQGEKVWMPIVLTTAGTLSGLQFGIHFDPSVAKFKNFRSAAMEWGAYNFGVFQDGATFCNTTPTAQSKYFEALSTLVEVEIEALQPFSFLQAFSISEEYLPALWVDELGVLHPFDTTLAMTSPQFEPNSDGFQIGASTPNPFWENTYVPVRLDAPAQIFVELSDVSGKRLVSRSLNLSEGEQMLQLPVEDIRSSGLIYYRIWSDNWSVAGKTLKL